jgi:16S rRNA (guanine966-N2)-methyltransferase
MIKILGGVARGFPLATPQVNSTRPTSVMIRRKLFDWRQNLEGFSFIDLFSGSGSMGFEALSRGADKVHLNESNRLAFKTIKQNQEKILKSFNFSKDALEVSQFDAKSWLQKELKYSFVETKDVILYLDPPYELHQLYFEVIDLLKSLKFEGEVWVESDRLKGPNRDDLIGLFCSIIKIIDQGDHFVVIGKLS